LGRRVTELTEQMRKVAAGDTDVEITMSSGTPELEAMASSLDSFRNNARALEQAREAETDERDKRERRQAEVERLRSEIEASVNGAVAGDFTNRVSANFGNADLTSLAGNLNRLLDVLDTSISETTRVMERLADGDLTDRMSGDYDGAFAKLQISVNATFERLGSMVVDINNRCAGMTTGCDTIAEGSRDLAERAERQASAVEETVATLEEMSSTVKANSENASTAADLAVKSSDQAKRGGDIVDNAVRAMGRIKESASRISEIISVIEGIAFQTNLLALNAAVEAARAGEAGKGFAVVASEVRTLAQRSRDAAADIKQLIDDSTTHVNDGVDLVEHTGAALRDIISEIEKVSATMSEITLAVREQAMGIEEMTRSVSHMDEITQRNASMADQSASNASAISNDARLLLEQVKFFAVEKHASTPKNNAAA
ncbi:MAG: methyl-accepting chemotaxis protein, partial [Pseudomonadota bacterium]